MLRFWSSGATLFCLVILIDVITMNVKAESSNADDVSDWEKFKTLHRKHYETHSDDMVRFNQWLHSRALILEQNGKVATGLRGFTMGDNEFSDWLPSEYQKLLGFRVRTSGSQKGQFARFMPTMRPDPQYNPYTNTVPVSELPVSVNWTSNGAVNPVQNQGQCGDCWAFSTCGALEGQYFMATGSLVVMSEQNLVDCTTGSPYNNLGCNGGSMNAAFEYVQQNKGIDSNSSYPYTGTSGTCTYSSSNSVGYNSGYQSVQYQNELALQQAVALIGPVSVGIDAGQPSFQLYKSGVYTSTKCSSVNLDHAVLAVGYGNTSDGQAYWLLKNSWGTSWGMNGYMMLARNDNNMCGIATDASFPLTFIASNNPVYQASSSSKMFGDFHSIGGVLLLLKLFTIYYLESD